MATQQEVLARFRRPLVFSTILMTALFVGATMLGWEYWAIRFHPNLTITSISNNYPIVSQLVIGLIWFIAGVFVTSHSALIKRTSKVGLAILLLYLVAGWLVGLAHQHLQEVIPGCFS